MKKFKKRILKKDGIFIDKQKLADNFLIIKMYRLNITKFANLNELLIVVHSY